MQLTAVAQQEGVQILAGSDAGDTYSFAGFGLHDELQELVKADLSPMESLKTATYNPAAYFAITADYGSIEVGKVADMILLDANPLDEIANTTRINQVIYDGSIYNRAMLDGLLEYVAKNASSPVLGSKLIWEVIGS